MRARGVVCQALLLLLLMAPALRGAAVEPAVPQSRAEIALSFAPVVKKAAPAVVSIFSRRVVTERRLASPLFDDPFFKRFFGESFGGLPQERVRSSLGSGVIVSGDGLVVTNHHVIAGADEIKVQLADNREFPATLVLTDERTDLAVLRIAAGGSSLPTLPFKDSDELEVGDLVLALGNPFGVGQTVTSGIVSALSRTLAGVSDFGFFIQTDAAINPGNSGGALVTLDGKLVGINTAIYSRSGGSIGIGFAIPADMVRTVVAAARSGGEVTRGWIGIWGQTLTAALAQGLGLDRPGGVVVSDLFPKGPGAAAGLRNGDVILAVAGVAVGDWESLRFRVATRELGEKLELSIWRGGKQAAVEVAVEAPPEIPPRDLRHLQRRHPLSGATIANLSPALAEQLDLQASWSGIVIAAVEPGSAAQRLGFRPGDIILSVNDERPGNTAALARYLEKGRGGSWRIVIRRAGEQLSLNLSE